MAANVLRHHCEEFYIGYYAAGGLQSQLDVFLLPGPPATLQMICQLRNILCWEEIGK